MKLLALFLLLPLGAQASPLGEVFSAYVKVRQAEEGLTLEPDEEGRQKLSASLTEARIGFHDALESKDKWENWEKALFHRLEKRSPATTEAKAMAFLQSNFTQPKELSPLEWQAIAEWFGKNTQEAFLRESFAIRELPLAKGEAPQIVWVKDPFRKLLPSPDRLEKTELEKLNPGVITLEISAFPSIDDQAEELRHEILSLGEKEFVLVSDGEASALVMKMLDLYPGLRERGNIHGWVNVSGRLYGRAGRKEKRSGRSIASVAVPAAAASDHCSQEALRDLRRIRQDSLVRGAPLGDGFPIVNLLSLDNARRPAENLREALVAEGSSWFVRGSAAKRIQSAFPLLSR
jgi:hypothetical protein